MTVIDINIYYLNGPFHYVRFLLSYNHIRYHIFMWVIKGYILKQEDLT